MGTAIRELEHCFPSECDGVPQSFIQRFSDLDFLRTIPLSVLVKVLRRFSVYLESGRGLHLDKCSVDDISHVLATPTDAIPPDLVDDLYRIRELGTQATYDRLLRVFHDKGVTFGVFDQVTPAELAARLCIEDHALFTRLHVQTQVARRRSFETYWIDGAEPSPIARRQPITELVSEIEGWFTQHGNGEHFQLFTDSLDTRTRLIVQHGGLIRREPAVHRDAASSVLYRPLVHDVILLDPDSGEVCLNIGTDRQRERDMYLQKFAKHFYGPFRRFHPATKYTLEPLRQGRSSVICSDVPDLVRVVLRSVTYQYATAGQSCTIDRDNDLFRAMERSGRTMPLDASLVEAKFELHFRKRQRPRSLVVRPGHVLVHARRDDYDLFAWFLNQRGFVVPRPSVERTNGLLARA